jgi:hypothetical protein
MENAAHDVERFAIVQHHFWLTHPTCSERGDATTADSGVYSFILCWCMRVGHAMEKIMI